MVIYQKSVLVVAARSRFNAGRDGCHLKLKETDIHALGQVFEDGLNRLQRVDKREKLRYRRRIRDELFSLLGWELASPAGILKRFEDRMPDLFRLLPYGFKDEVMGFLIEKMSIDKGLAAGKTEVQLIRERRQLSSNKQKQ